MDRQLYFMKTNSGDNDMVEAYTMIGRAMYLAFVVHKDLISNLETRYGDSEDYLDDGVMVEMTLCPTMKVPEVFNG